MQTLRRTLKIAGAILFALTIQSCATRTTVVIDSSSDIVRLGPDVRGHVYIWDTNTKTWALSTDKVTLPAGWYAGPMDPK